MKTIQFSKTGGSRFGDTLFSGKGVLLIFYVLMLLYMLLPQWIQWQDSTAGMIDHSVWLLLLFALISFLGMVLLCGWLLQCFLRAFGLPKISYMVSQFKNLTLCQQYIFYLSFFALLLLAGVGSMIAIF